MGQLLARGEGTLRNLEDWNREGGGLAATPSAKRKPSASKSRFRGRHWATAGAIAAGVALAGCGTAAAGASHASSDLVSASTVVHQTISIETGKMDGRPGWPKFVPADFSAPAGATIVLTIVNHDDGTAPLPSSSPWNQVWGSDATYGAVSGGTEVINGQRVTEIADEAISHTLEIPGLLVNIPIPAASSSSTPVTVVYTFRVLKKGTYMFICAAPCGSGSAGMGGAMGATGWMRGYVHIS